jgi:hypothetical protein
MLKHVVMWQFLEQAEGKSKAENMAWIRQALLELAPRIPDLLSIEIGEDIGVGRDPYDMCLITTFTDAEALDRYQHHPEHKLISAYVSKVRSGRACVDFNLSEAHVVKGDR